MSVFGRPRSRARAPRGSRGAQVPHPLGAQLERQPGLPPPHRPRRARGQRLWAAARAGQASPSGRALRARAGLVGRWHWHGRRRRSRHKLQPRLGNKMGSVIRLLYRPWYPGSGKKTDSMRISMQFLIPGLCRICSKGVCVACFVTEHHMFRSILPQYCSGSFSAVRGSIKPKILFYTRRPPASEAKLSSMSVFRMRT